MATTLVTRSYKRVTVTMEEKARALRVFEIGEENRLAVTSGSRPNSAYVVHHNGKHVTYCPCNACGQCSHKIAGNWYLEAMNRAISEQAFDLSGLNL